MKRVAWWLGVAAWSLSLTCAAEEITLSTYYPSPRGVYQELRAGRYMGLDPKGTYVLDMAAGTIDVAMLVLHDAKTGRRYGLSVEDGRVLLTDVEQKQSYLLFELMEPGEP